VGIFSPDFYRARDELWSSNEKVVRELFACSPAASSTVNYYKSIALSHWSLPTLRRAASQSPLRAVRCTACTAIAAKGI